MTDITTISNKLLTGDLSVSEKAFNSPKICKFTNYDLYNVILSLLTELYYKVGQRVQGNELKTLTEAFLVSLEKYKWITLKELEYVFEMGRKKEFGEYYGLNINTFEIWIESWDKKERQKVLLSKKFDTEIIEEKMSEADQDEFMIKAIEKAKKEFKETGLLNSGAIGQYEWLDKKGKFLEHFGGKEKWHQLKRNEYAKAKIELKKELETTIPESMEQNKEIKNEILRIEEKGNGKVIAKAKKNILKEYYLMEISL